MAKFYGIGTGPGDSGLVTVKAVQTLKNCDILYTPEPKKNSKSLAYSIVESYLPSDLIVKQRHFPMSYNQAEKMKAWQNIAEEIEQDVKAGNNVGFITLGDPMIYSTYSYLLELLAGHIETETIPGISSFSNIASSVGMPLVMDEETLAVIPCTVGSEAIEQALTHFSAVILMKVTSDFSLVLQLLRKYGLLEQATLVSDSSMKSEQIISDLSQFTGEEKISYFSTIIVKRSAVS
ncbi:cobalt-factor II C(20)-methyltransferase [Bacillus massiliigorillae]|uniref:cobalt-factor II C(20)-methyltransferase n=1 Tax=Bacillus massiliigorillae TaxID=1243664 RepID=UPI00039B855A|nr:cobalt-factor II C(20)-methyltransferase [Bacillus massiliigorillae]